MSGGVSLRFLDPGSTPYRLQIGGGKLLSKTPLVHCFFLLALWFFLGNQTEKQKWPMQNLLGSFHFIRNSEPTSGFRRLFEQNTNGKNPTPTPLYSLLLLLGGPFGVFASQAKSNPLEMAKMPSLVAISPAFS